jgi:hypothetical protein
MLYLCWCVVQLAACRASYRYTSMTRVNRKNLLHISYHHQVAKWALLGENKNTPNRQSFNSSYKIEKYLREIKKDG